MMHDITQNGFWLHIFGVFFTIKTLKIFFKNATNVQKRDNKPFCFTRYAPESSVFLRCGNKVKANRLLLTTMSSYNTEYRPNICSLWYHGVNPLAVKACRRASESVSDKLHRGDRVRPPYKPNKSIASFSPATPNPRVTYTKTPLHTSTVYIRNNFSRRPNSTTDVCPSVSHGTYTLL